MSAHFCAGPPKCGQLRQKWKTSGVDRSKTGHWRTIVSNAWPFAARKYHRLLRLPKTSASRLFSYEPAAAPFRSVNNIWAVGANANRRKSNAAAAAVMGAFNGC